MLTCSLTYLNFKEGLTGLQGKDGKMGWLAETSRDSAEWLNLQKLSQTLSPHGHATPVNIDDRNFQPCLLTTEFSATQHFYLNLKLKARNHRLSIFH